MGTAAGGTQSRPAAGSRSYCGAARGLFFPGFFEGFAHGFSNGSNFGVGEFAPGGLAAAGGDFVGEGVAAGLDVVVIGDEGGGVVGLDAHVGGGGDGVLVGTEEQELPVVNHGLLGDALVDVGHGEFAGRIFLAVGKDGDDDLGGALGLGSGGEFAADIVNGAADGVEQRSVAARLIGFERERRRGLDRRAVVDGQIFVVEENQGEGGGDRLAGVVHGRLLGLEEFIEAGNGGIGHGTHGTGSVEDECDFCFHIFVGERGGRSDQ